MCLPVYRQDPLPRAPAVDILRSFWMPLRACSHARFWQKRDDHWQFGDFSAWANWRNRRSWCEKTSHPVFMKHPGCLSKLDLDPSKSQLVSMSAFLGVK